MLVAGAIPLGPGRHRPWWFQLLGLRRELEVLAAADPAFQVATPGGGLLCPFCLAEVRGDGLVAHLLHDCREFFGPRTPIAAAGRRREALERLQIRERLRTSTAWRATDEHGFWVCPFCGASTPVYFCRELASDDELAAGVQAHLARCAAFGTRRDPLAADDLWARVQAMEREELLAQRVRQRILAGDGFFDRVTAAGDWVCPFCLQAQEGLRIDSRARRERLAPARITRHLLRDCPAFRARPVTRTRAEIRERVRELDARALAADLPPTVVRVVRSA